MRYNIHLLKYKSYFNRVSKRLETLDEYLKYEIAPYVNKDGTYRSINIKLGDGINVQTEPLYWDNDTPDYCILHDLKTNEISRWFVQEFHKNVGGQYTAYLYRDVIDENINEILNATTYVEKGYVKNSSPLIYNQEQFSCNQIKTKEIPIYDESSCPWLVAYLPADAIKEDITIKLSSSVITNLITTVATAVPQSELRLFHSDSPESMRRYNELKSKNGEIHRYLTDEGTQMYTGPYITRVIESFTKDFDSSTKILYISYNDISEYIRSGENLEMTIEKDKVKQLINAPYVMICAPYSDRMSYNNIIIYKEVILKMFQAIAANIGSGKVFDVQILPFCPLDIKSNYSIYDNADLFTLSNIDDYIYTTIKSKNIDLSTYTDLCPVFYCTKSSFTKTFTIPYKAGNSGKLGQLELYRLCSPNYNGLFEFSPSKNNGFTGIINVDCTYRPYSPYIHVSPIFNNLYGSDFNDQRGLICGGDFSIDQVNDAWANYEMNNKNYQKMFDRQIQNMDTNYLLDGIGNAVSVGTSTLAGAAAGFMVGGPAGAVVGGVASGIGGLADTAIEGIKYHETKDYTKDMYNMRLDNVKALPQSLSKSSAINENSRYVPFIEYYNCTTEETAAFLEKITYNGMTINVIGKLKNYLEDNSETYIKGQIIRINLSNDTHYINTIAEEVYKGFFYKKEV